MRITQNLLQLAKLGFWIRDQLSYRYYFCVSSLAAVHQSEIYVVKNKEKTTSCLSDYITQHSILFTTIFTVGTLPDKTKNAEFTSANWLKMVKYQNKFLAKFYILKKIMRLINKRNLYLASVSTSEIANFNSNQDFVPVD